MYKKVMQQLLFELIKGSKRSDRELAKVLRVSQPTVTRMRKKLEETAITEYTIVPNWNALEFELMAMTFVNIRGESKAREEQEKTIEKCKKWMMDHPNIIFASDGAGMGMDRVMISFHKDYTDYSKFITEHRIKWAETLGEIKSFIVSVKGGEILKPFSLKYLEKTLRQ
jgi:DNA-binding Lrp family transcriptional regulator